MARRRDDTTALPGAHITLRRLPFRAICRLGRSLPHFFQFGDTLPNNARTRNSPRATRGPRTVFAPFGRGLTPRTLYRYATIKI